ncbi:MAG: phage Gp37/Gp68 family protein [Planctomycetales bacterium]|nr:phage Gp37/Gp68 family protein [Planctomycetales bacterium]
MEHSKIEWTDHTFNPWIGCAKVNSLCKLCYAETMMDTRYGRVRWGPDGTRVRTTPDYWRKPFGWNKKAVAAGVRRRVFCASLADVFEDRRDLVDWRRDLVDTVIDLTPKLDWLMLTKRPENIGRMLAAIDRCGSGAVRSRSNVWLGASVGDQATADAGVAALTRWRPLSPVLFLSVEPLLGPIPHLPLGGIDWVIVGGESGRGARPMELAWVQNIRDQCRSAGVPFFFKQWGGVNKSSSGRRLEGRLWDELPFVCREQHRPPSLVASP